MLLTADVTAVWGRTSRKCRIQSRWKKRISLQLHPKNCTPYPQSHHENY